MDFSLLQAVASWIQEALRSAPAHLTCISRSGALLSQAVAPTSGLGLLDIWSSWSGSVKLNSHLPGLEQAISDDVNADGYSGSRIYWSSETWPHSLAPSVTGRFATETTSTGPGSESDDVLTSTRQVSILCSLPA
jgi:hypothetical protein